MVQAKTARNWTCRTVFIQKSHLGHGDSGMSLYATVLVAPGDPPHPSSHRKTRCILLCIICVCVIVLGGHSHRGLQLLSESFLGTWVKAGLGHYLLGDHLGNFCQQPENRLQLAVLLTQKYLVWALKGLGFLAWKATKGCQCAS